MFHEKGFIVMSKFSHNVSNTYMTRGEEEYLMQKFMTIKQIIGVHVLSSFLSFSLDPNYVENVVIMLPE